MKVNPIDVDKGMNVIDLLDQFDESGVLGAGKVARACNILAEMIQDEDMNVFLSLGGPLIPGGRPCEFDSFKWCKYNSRPC